MLEAHRDMAHSQCDMARSFAPFWAVLAPLEWSHVVLEVQRDMAGAQYDVARSFYSLLGGFGPLVLVPRHVGGPTRHGGFPMRHGAPLSGHFNKKATSELSQRWQALFLLFGFLFA